MSKNTLGFGMENGRVGGSLAFVGRRVLAGLVVKLWF